MENLFFVKKMLNKEFHFDIDNLNLDITFIENVLSIDEKVDNFTVVEILDTLSPPWNE